MFIRGIRQQALKDWTDERLVEAFCETGDEQYFTELFGRYTMQVFLICKQYLNDREESREMVMRIFSKLLEILPGLEIRIFRNWLPVVVQRECLNHLRKQGRYVPLKEAQVPIPEEEPEIYPATEELPIGESEIKAALAQLDEAQRVCLNLFFFKKMSYRQVSGQTGFPLNEVKSYLQNGKRQLKKQLLNLITTR
ncbi:MAG: sigma-70 family RNA polymerase sigma factor [Saprospiraceae bacterium]|nr:sigma-70 family RNA polymerase sigma factor [Saprospiraceae bacterium]